MPADYSLRAVLSATDKNMSSTFKNAISTVETFGDRVKSIVASIGVTKALSAATNLLTSSLDGAIERYDTIHTYPKVMQSLGYSTEDAQASVSKLDAAVQGLPTSLSDMVSSAQKLTSVTGDMDKATDTAIALNNALLASSASTEDVSRATQQYSQMLATGTVDLESWRTLQETMSPSLTKVAKKLGIASGSTQELYNAMKAGTISFDDFNTALIECNNEAGGFADTAKEASKTIRTGFTNIQSAVQNLEMSFIGAMNNILSSQGFGGIVDILDRIKTAIYNVRNAFMESENGIDYVFKPEVLQRVNQLITDISTNLTNAWNTFKNTGAIDTLASALQNVQAALAHISNSIDWGGAINSLANWFGQLVTQISLAVENVMKFIQSIDPSVIDFFAQAVVRAFEAFATYKVVSTAASAVKNFGSAAGGAVSNVKNLYSSVKNLYSNLKGGKSIKDILGGKSSGASSDPTAELVQSSKKAASTLDSIFSGISKIIEKAGETIKTVCDGIADVISSMGDAIKSVFEGLGSAIESLGTALATVAKGIGEGISTALKGLGQALASVPATTWLAIGAAALLVGAAFALVGTQGEGLQLVLQGVATVISALAPIVQTVVNGIVAVVGQLPAIFVSVGEAVKSACEGIGSVIESLGAGIASVVTSITDGMATIVEAIGSAISGVLNALANIISSIGEAALNAGTGFERLAMGVERITKLPILDMVGSLGALVGALGGVTALSGGLATAGAGMTQFASAVSSVGLSGPAAAAALTLIQASLATLGSSATASMNELVSALSQAESSITSAGKSISDGFVKTVQSGLKQLPSIAKSAMNSLISALNATKTRAYQAGVYIGQGLANGMQSTLGQVRAAAAQLASAADEAIRAKAAIASPSKVTTRLGEYFGEGFAIGIENMQRLVQTAADSLFAIPYASSVSLSFAGLNSSLSSDYSYLNSAEYTINVPLEINGREFARATATQTQDEIDRNAKLRNRIKGVK